MHELLFALNIWYFKIWNKNQMLNINLKYRFTSGRQDSQKIIILSTPPQPITFGPDYFSILQKKKIKNKKPWLTEPCEFWIPYKNRWVFNIWPAKTDLFPKVHLKKENYIILYLIIEWIKCFKSSNYPNFENMNSQK